MAPYLVCDKDMDIRSTEKKMNPSCGYIFYLDLYSFDKGKFDTGNCELCIKVIFIFMNWGGIGLFFLIFCSFDKAIIGVEISNPTVMFSLSRLDFIL